jgi:hypothetical protein
VLVGVVLTALVAQAAAQFPSPMSDSTRPHPRVERYDVPGRRVPLTLGTLYISPAFNPASPHVLLVHFHGAPWLVEHHVRERLPQAVLVTVQIGSGSRVYADALTDPIRFAAVLDEAESRLRELIGQVSPRRSIVLSSFSAGYGAIRSILSRPEDARRVDAVVLADSLHAAYIGDAAVARTADLPVDLGPLEPFLLFAEEAAAGRKTMWVTHSEVYPGTYASTTETADTLLRRVGLSRRPALDAGPIGMQQLSETGRGQSRVTGYAGNSAPDHMDHLYALGTWLSEVVRSQRR